MRVRLLYFGGFFTGAGLTLIYTYYVLMKFATSIDRGIVAPLERLMQLLGSAQYQQLRETMMNLYSFVDAHLGFAIIVLLIGVILTVLSIRKSASQ